MSDSKLDILYELDKGEENRKADYTIWGYLYQFDLMLFDMLNQNTKDDFFNDMTNNIDAKYEIEMVEDYSKQFVYGDKECIRIAQIKYHSQAKEFKDTEAIVLLYYAFLKFINLKCNSNITFKSSLLYYNKKREEWDKEKIRDFLKESLNKYMENEVEQQVAISQETTSINTSENNKKEKNNLKKRVIKIIEELSNDRLINRFVEESVTMLWVCDRQSLINNIKTILENKYSGYFTKYKEERKDILYSLCINYIINSWQKKNKRNERVYIKLSDIDNNLKVLSQNEDKINYERLIGSIRGYFDEMLNDINELLLEDYSELEITNILHDYLIIAESLYYFLESVFKNKKFRFSFLNTISMNEFISLAEYNSLNIEDEYIIFLENKEFICSYISRAMKFIYTHKKNNIQYDLNIENWFFIDNELWLFTCPSDKRGTILLPKPYKKPKLIHNRILKRICKSQKRPYVWYFGELKLKGFYDLEFNKPEFNTLNQNVIEIDKPYRKDSYFIECMKCLKEDEPVNINKVNSIFDKRCITNNEEKS